MITTEEKVMTTVLVILFPMFACLIVVLLHRRAVRRPVRPEVERLLLALESPDGWALAGDSITRDGLRIGCDHGGLYVTLKSGASCLTLSTGWSYAERTRVREAADAVTRRLRLADKSNKQSESESAFLSWLRKL